MRTLHNTMAIADTGSSELIDAYRVKVEDEAALQRVTEKLREHDSASADALDGNMQRLRERLPADALVRWMLTGMRLCSNDPQKRRCYFSLQDARALAALENEASAPSLGASIASLSMLLEALTSRHIRIQEQRLDLDSSDPFDLTPGRPVLSSTHLLLPSDYSSLESSGPDLLFRASVAHAAAHLNHSPAAQPAGTLKPMSLAIISAIEDARAEQLLIRDLPGTRAWFLPLLKTSLQPEGLSFSALVSRMNYALIDPTYQDDNYWVNKARTLFDGLATSLHDYTSFREIASVLANDLGQMRVRFHPQQYVVPAPYRDDNSFLWTYPETTTPQSVEELQVESSLTGMSSPQDNDEQVTTGQEVRRLQYPEWDYRRDLLRPDWCTVIERRPPSPSASHRMSVQTSTVRVKLPATASLTRNARLRRQPEGEELDLDAAIEHTIDRRRGHSPEHRVFTRPGTRQRSMSLLLLLDLSASTGDIAPGEGRSFLDMEKEAAHALVQAARSAGHRIASHGFSSNTRECVNYYRLLDFDAPLDETSSASIDTCTARYSTRMGAAIRHAASLISTEASERRVIIVITDGTPSDIDVFDNDYLVRDAQLAAQDARRAGIVTCGIAVDEGGADYMRRIVGREDCRIVNTPATLPAQLVALFARIAAS
jgi:nitric oxide reductase NorD protein